MRRVLLLSFLVFFINCYAEQFDAEVNKNLITQIKPSVWSDSEIDLNKISNHNFISVFSLSLNREFKLKVLTPSLAEGIIPFADDWEIKNFQLSFNNVKNEVSLLGNGNYLGENEQIINAEEEVVCQNRSLDIKNSSSKNKMFLVAFNQETKKFLQYYGLFKDQFTFDTCNEYDKYVIKKVFFD